MTTRLDQPGTMPKMRPTRRSPSSKAAARKQRQALAKELRERREAVRRLKVQRDGSID